MGQVSEQKPQNFRVNFHFLLTVKPAWASEHTVMPHTPFLKCFSLNNSPNMHAIMMEIDEFM